MISIQPSPSPPWACLRQIKDNRDLGPQGELPPLSTDVRWLRLPGGAEMDQNVIGWCGGLESQNPPEDNKPLMVLLNLPLGPGWPIDKTPNPSTMEVD